MGLLASALSEPLRVLEVGHYFGLSTCAIVTALRQRPGDWSMLSLDAHIADPWVQRPAAIVDFERNRSTLFSDDRLTVSYERSQTLGSDLPYDVVFYDGDHGEEQRRFTRAVIESRDPKLFIFDDRNFDVPSKCCKDLVEAGWRDESPPYCRGGGDKANPLTMTLGVFRR